MIANGTPTAASLASDYLRAGISVIPIRGDQTKAPAVSWKPYQSRLASQQETRSWFIADNVGIAVVCGAVSGNLEVIDIDDRETYGPFAQALERLEPGLLDRLAIVKTPRPGYHLYYRCEVIEGNQKLAQTTVGGNVKVLIETRGEGGYVLAPGSPGACHPTGRTYEHLGGPELTKIPTITPQEREALFRAARSLDTLQAEQPQSSQRATAAGLSPGDDFNQRTEWADILTPHGWEVDHAGGGKVYWRRPGKANGWSGTTGIVSKEGNELFCCFSDNAHPFQGASGNRPCSSYTKFAAYATLNHAGDFSAAAKQLRSEGYGENVQHVGQKPDAKMSTTVDKIAPPKSEPVGSLSEQPEPPNRKPIPKFTISELREKYPELHPPVVEGLIREGETANLIAASKVGKSWAGYGLLLSIATGRQWLDTFNTTKGRVLLVDNELHAPTLANRIPAVAEAMEMFQADYEDNLDIWPLRGNLRSLNELADEFETIEPGYYKAVLWDAKYRFIMGDENSNTEQTQFYNRLDQLAMETGSAMILVHHSTKGSQSDKRVTDVGSGAGAMSRAADCHAVIREHEEEGVAVLEAAVRSFAPVDPLAIRWNFPLWIPDHDADATKLKGKLSGQEQRQQDKDKEGKQAIVDALLHDSLTARKLRAATGISRERMTRLLDKLTADDQILATEIKVKGNTCYEYSLPRLNVGD